MTIHAYQEIYLTNAQAALGDLFDYAINVLKLKSKDFINMFLASSTSKRIEKGDVLYIVGKSGIEMLLDIVEETTNKKIEIDPIVQYARSREYWIGWAVAYYQWYSSRTFKEIFDTVSFAEFEVLYTTMHEADITKLIDVINQQIKSQNKGTRLKRIRQRLKFTQAELAKRSNVSLRSIQMYEQQNKDINKASVETIKALAKALSCEMEDILEPNN
ncbi:MAG: helix-turn-helix transcriptional regulator [Clostridiales bacterium]|nr:helix-turn-helix transcriptional regulator [Clostridiales bacterium]